PEEESHRRSPSCVSRSVDPDLRRGGQPERDCRTVAAGRDRAGPRRHLDDLEATAWPDLVAPEILEKLLVGFRLFCDALDDDGRAFLGLCKGARLDPRRPPRARGGIAMR